MGPWRLSTVKILGSDTVARLTRNRGSKRQRARRGDGRFVRSTLANTFGLKALVCAKCRTFNTVPLGEARPETCHACGESLRDLSEGSK